MRKPSPQNYRLLFGFSLIEILVVLAIVAILAVLAIPSNRGQITQVQINETLKLMGDYQMQIANYYKLHLGFPSDNAEAGLPAPDKIVGNYLQATYIADGAIHLQLGNKINTKLTGRMISIRPLFVPDESNVPVSWICGNDSVPAGMLAAGENLTDLENQDLPIRCR